MTYTVTVTDAGGFSAQSGLTLTVTNAPPTPPVVTQFGVGAGPSFGLSGTGPTGAADRILAATNALLPLSNWSVAATGTFTNGAFSFSDPQFTNQGARFYRVATP